MIVIKSGLQRCCVWGRCNMILTTYIFLTAAQNGPLRSQTYLCLTAKGKWSICATLCQVYTNSFSLSLSVSSWVFVCCLSKISSQFWNLSKCVLILMNNVKFNYAEVTAFKMEMSTQCHKSNQPSTMSCFTRNIIFSSRQLFDFALLPPCISDWAPIRADCIWELPVCHQLRRRQPQPQDQCDPSEPLQQLRLPGGDASRQGSCTARVPPEAPTSRYSFKKAWSNWSMSIDISYHCMTIGFVPFSPGLVRSHACTLDQFGKAGGCSDICLLSNSHKTRTCRCRSGFSLGSDGKSCKSEYPDWGEHLPICLSIDEWWRQWSNSGYIMTGRSHDCYSLRICISSSAAEPDHELFLVYGKGRPGIIRGMDMNAKVPDEYMIPIENLMNPRALDFHAAGEFIYFADATNYIIGRQKIDGTERDTILKEGKNTMIALHRIVGNIFTLSKSRNLGRTIIPSGYSIWFSLHSLHIHLELASWWFLFHTDFFCLSQEFTRWRG